MFTIGEQHSILIDIDKSTLQGAELECLNARSIFEIIQVSANRMIQMNAGFLHEICTEDEYKIYVHAEAKEFVSRITITNVEIIEFIVKYIFVISLEANDFQIKIKYHAIFTKTDLVSSICSVFFRS